MISTKKITLILSLVFLSQTTFSQEYMVGADLSFVKEAEDKGFSFKENNIVKPGLDIFREHGYNWIRLRLFNSPKELPNDLEYTIALAKEAKKKGYKFLLDYHYSDTWADPGNQAIPKAWKNASFAVLKDSVYTLSLIHI